MPAAESTCFRAQIVEIPNNSTGKKGKKPAPANLKWAL